MCLKYKKIEGDHSNIQHGDHDEIATEMVFDSNVNTNYTDKNKGNPTSSTKSTTSNNTWIRNISSTPLTEGQVNVLSHGPNFTVVPRCLPVGEYIASIEEACTQLKQGEAEELRREVKAILKKIQPQSIISQKKNTRH